MLARRLINPASCYPLTLSSSTRPRIPPFFFLPSRSIVIPLCTFKMTSLSIPVQTPCESSDVPTAPAPASTNQEGPFGTRKRLAGKPPGRGAARKLRKKQKRNAAVKATRNEGTHEEVLLADVQELLNKCSMSDSKSALLKETPYETEVTISELSSTGDGIGFHEADQRFYVVPFTLPGDRVLTRVFKHDYAEPVSLGDFIKVIEASPLRDDSRVQCKYFAQCSGCQFQMMGYDEQLVHKRRVVERAYRNFSNIRSDLIPTINDTMPSPLQFGYRTKLTPHFDGPPGGRRDRRDGNRPKFESVPPIGFMKKGTRHTIDIEDCPIGTEAVRRGMARERRRVAEQLDTYQRGATILLRENTRRLNKGSDLSTEDEVGLDADVVREDTDNYVYFKSCETNQTATTTEYIGDYVFQNPAGAFFQNNNSILAPFTDFVGTLAQPLGPEPSPVKPTESGGTDEADAVGREDGNAERRRLKYLVDAYSGSGLFTITLSHLFEKSVGIDISTSSIEYASKNAQLNGLQPSRACFMAADAVRIFDDAITQFPADETVVVIDPPRKGCDIPFLRQLMAYGPTRIVYVSCNVHTQARDVGILVNGLREEGSESRNKADDNDDGDGDGDGDVGSGQGPYRLVSLRGMDFFPQTGHVEGVAVLVRKN